MRKVQVINIAMAIGFKRIGYFLYNSTIGLISSSQKPNITLQSLKDFITKIEGPLGHYRALDEDPCFEMAFEDAIRPLHRIGIWLNEHEKDTKEIGTLEDEIEAFQEELTEFSSILHDRGFADEFNMDKHLANMGKAENKFYYVALEPHRDKIETILKNYKSLKTLFEELNTRELNTLKDCFVELADYVPEWLRCGRENDDQLCAQFKDIGEFLDGIIKTK